ncbi:hypothetical protein FH972_022784 [Carpinus fangiana]|uniref:Uncharacterized protein n=1 Tax=Carpinus fangiana TaxID=176857 RepID=A0A5N6KT92_9ROSI|nr:hypothetical protein FH972_022784 [Carpinus fangiana]
MAPVVTRRVVHHVIAPGSFSPQLFSLLTSFCLCCKIGHHISPNKPQIVSITPIMSSTSTVGLLPRLLPVTGSFLGPFAALNLFLSVSVVRSRLQTEYFLGNQSKSPEKISLQHNSSNIDPVLLSTSVYNNFLDNIPLAFAAAAVVELNGGSRKALSYALGGLFLARISHIVGLTQGLQPFRLGGYLGSLGIITGLGGWAAYLAKGYWGL